MFNSLDLLLCYYKGPGEMTLLDTMMSRNLILGVRMSCHILNPSPFKMLHEMSILGAKCAKI